MQLSRDDLRRLGAPLPLARDGAEARRRKVRECFAGNPGVATKRRHAVLMELEARDLVTGEGALLRELGVRADRDDAAARAEWLALVYRRASRVRRLMIQAARSADDAERRR